MAVFDVVEAIAVARTSLCTPGSPPLTRIQVPPCCKDDIRPLFPLWRALRTSWRALNNSLPRRCLIFVAAHRYPHSSVFHPAQA